jgi:enoyl-[acyl-carrier-protein] reductase (NADH)
MGKALHVTDSKAVTALYQVVSKAFQITTISSVTFKQALLMLWSRTGRAVPLSYLFLAKAITKYSYKRLARAKLDAGQAENQGLMCLEYSSRD